MRRRASVFWVCKKTKRRSLLMYNKIRQPGAMSAPMAVARLQAIEAYVPLCVVSEVLQRHPCKQRRVRKLCLSLIVYLLITMNLFAHERLALVLGRLMVTFRWLLADEPAEAAG